MTKLIIKDTDKSDDDDVSSIEDTSPKHENEEATKEKKKVTIKEDEDGKPVVESDQAQENDKGTKKKSKACTIL